MAKKKSQFLQILNDTANEQAISAMVDDVAVIHESGANFPISSTQFGVFKPSSVVIGYRNVKVEVTGGTSIDIIDSINNFISVPVTGPGVYNIDNVWFDEPNEFTRGVGITLT